MYTLYELNIDFKKKQSINRAFTRLLLRSKDLIVLIDTSAKTVLRFEI